MIRNINIIEILEILKQSIKIQYTLCIFSVKISNIKEYNF